MSRALLPCLALVLLSTACSSHRWTINHDPEPKLLREVTASDGALVRYELRVGTPRLVQTEQRNIDRAWIGIETKDINADLATVLGVSAWRGVYVDRVLPGTPAERAGLLQGDILRFLAGTEVTAREQVRELIQSQLRPGEAATVSIQRWMTDEAGLHLLSHELQVVPEARPVEETRTVVHELPFSRAVQSRTGMQLGELGPELARAVYDSDGPAVVVTGVVSGSPAYRAGFRSADRVVAADGAPVQRLTDVERAVVARVVDEGWELTAGELKLLGNGGSVPAAEGRLELGVDGPLGGYTRRLDLIEDVDDDVAFYFPILFDYEADVARTEWAFLDFILQFGATYESSYIPARTRAPAANTEFSMLPFGMFEYRSTPDSSEWTFFWFITFKV